MTEQEMVDEHEYNIKIVTTACALLNQATWPDGFLELSVGLITYIAKIALLRGMPRDQFERRVASQCMAAYDLVESMEATRQ